MLSEVSRLLKVTIVGGSIPERSGDKLYNTCCVFGTDGELKAKHRKVVHFSPLFGYDTLIAYIWYSYEVLSFLQFHSDIHLKNAPLWFSEHKTINISRSGNQEIKQCLSSSALQCSFI